MLLNDIAKASILKIEDTSKNKYVEINLFNEISGESNYFTLNITTL